MSNSPSQTAKTEASKPADTKAPAPAAAQAAVKAPRKAASTPAAKAVIAAQVKAPAKVSANLAAKTDELAATKAPAAKKPATVKTPTAVKPAAAPAKAVSDKAGKKEKRSGKKPKLVRDSFTLPAVDYALFGSLKQRALKNGHDVKKSELLRAGLAVLAELSDAALLSAVQAIDRLKPGRPGK